MKTITFDDQRMCPDFLQIVNREETSDLRLLERQLWLHLQGCTICQFELAASIWHGLSHNSPSKPPVQAADYPESAQKKQQFAPAKEYEKLRSGLKDASAGNPKLDLYSHRELEKLIAVLDNLESRNRQLELSAQLTQEFLIHLVRTLLSLTGHPWPTLARHLQSFLQGLQQARLNSPVEIR